MQELTKAILTLQCPYCGEPPGFWCTSPKSHRRSRYLHADRGRAVYRAWQIGYREGVPEGVGYAARDLENGGSAGDLFKRCDVVRWLRAVERDSRRD